MLIAVKPAHGTTVLSVSLVASLLLAACGSASPPTTVDTPAPPVVAADAGLPGDHAITRRYRIAISYPLLAPDADALSRALREQAASIKRQFMQALPDPQKLPEFANRQLQLLIDYKVSSRTSAFVSVRGQGMMDTGGAHPLPLDATFVFDRRARRLVALDDLFADPDAARRMLAGFTRGVLEQTLLSQAPGGDEATPEVRKEWQTNMRTMIDAGTRPDAKNFTEFAIDPGGLVLIFPPYQVAPYVYGAQTVKVPLKAFGEMLKPGYRGAFGPAP